MDMEITTDIRRATFSNARVRFVRGELEHDSSPCYIQKQQFWAIRDCLMTECHKLLVEKGNKVEVKWKNYMEVNGNSVKVEFDTSGYFIVFNIKSAVYPFR